MGSLLCTWWFDGTVSAAWAQDIFLRYPRCAEKNGLKSMGTVSTIVAADDKNGPTQVWDSLTPVKAVHQRKSSRASPAPISNSSVRPLLAPQSINRNRKSSRIPRAQTTQKSAGVIQQADATSLAQSQKLRRKQPQEFDDPGEKWVTKVCTRKRTKQRHFYA